MRTQLLFILISFFCGHQSIAQVTKTSTPVLKSVYTIKGDYYRHYRNYVLAINTYSKAINQNPKEVSAMLGMADAYHLLGKNDQAGQWYRKAFAINPDVGEDQILKYIEILSASGNSTELRQLVTLYNTKVKKSGEPYDSSIFVTENLTSLNSKGSDSAPILFDSKMIFSSDRATAGNFNSYKSTFNSEGIFGEVSPLHGAINSGRSDGGFAIASNTATLFFTGTEKESTTTPPTMELFTSAIPTEPSEKLKVNKLTFKNFDHSIGHPAVNSNGTMLYFAAHSPKHTRGFDLYHSQYDGKKWSPPIALGASVNSHGDEMYPVLVNDSILYFASNGHGGLGGFDIFKINLRHLHHHQPEHLPAPVNSTADEFGFVMNSTGSESYLSSNRPGGLGGNDIYRIYILPFKKKKHNASPKQDELFMYTSKGDEIKISGGSKENLKFDFQPGQKYNLVIEYDNFRTGTTQSIKDAATLTKLNVYTIDIQKSSKAVYDQKNKGKPTQDIHLNPGDLVTFQLIPNMIQDPDADVSKIQFQKSEATISDGQSIVFSYVAEGGPMPEANTQQIADLNKLDTVSITQPITSASVISPVQSTTVKTNDSIAVAGTAVETQKQKLPESVPEQSANKISTPVNANVVVAEKLDEKNPTPSKNVNDTTLTKTSVVSKKDVDASATEVSSTEKIVSTEVASTEPVPVKSNGVQTTPLAIPVSSVVMAAKLDEKNPVRSKNTNDTTLTKTSIVAKKDVAAKATIISPTEKIVSTEVASTEPVPVKSNGVQTTPLAIPVSSVVVAAKLDEKNPTPSKNASDTTLTKTSVATKKDDPNATKVLPTEKVVSTQLASTQPVPVKSNDVQTTPFANSVSTTDIQYRVQIAASKSNLSDDQLKKIYAGPNEIRSFTEDGYNKYYIEQTSSFPTAKSTLNKSGVAQAFIAAYQGDKKLKLPEAIALQKKAGNQPSSPINQSEITNSPKPPVVTTQLNNSTEVVAEKSTIEKIVSDSTKNSEENLAVASTQSSQITPGKIPATDATIQNTTQENKTPVSNSVTNKPVEVVTVQTTNEVRPEKIALDSTKESKNEPVSIASTQPKNSEVATENVAPTTKKAGDEKQVAVVIPSTQKISTSVPEPEVKRQDNAVLKKPSHDIAGRNDFLYRLQIAASEVPMSEASLKNIYAGSNKVNTFKEDGMYKYNIIETSNYFVARQSLKETNVNQAFISAYKKDVKIPLEEAINDQYKVPVTKENLTEIDSVIKIITVNFEFDQFELKPDQLERLRSNVVNELMSNPSYRAIVNGYADSRGSEKYNFGLSQERALFVDQYIEAQGVDAEKVTTRYFGESQLAKHCPENGNCDESINQANRRVEILLLVNKK